MKKGTIIIALLGIIVIAGYALYLTLTKKNDGNIETNQPPTEGEARQEETPGGQAQSAGEAPQGE